jgi:presenilin-like A22 family membrane protease
MIKEVCLLALLYGTAVGLLLAATWLALAAPGDATSTLRRKSNRPGLANLAGAARQGQAAERADSGDVGPFRWRRALLSGAAMVAAATLLLAGMNHLDRSRNWLIWVFAAAAVTSAISSAHRFTRTTATRLVVTVAGLALVGIWLLRPSWLTSDLVAGLLILDIMNARWNIPFAQMAVIGVFLAAGYDAVQVFITHSMTAAATVGTQRWMPMLIAIPAGPGLHAQAALVIGLGDIAVPGFLAVMAGQIGQRTGRRVYYRAAVTGYAVSLAAGLAVLALTGAPLPALVFVIPGVVGAVCIAAWRTRSWGELTQDQDARPVPLPVTQP